MAPGRNEATIGLMACRQGSLETANMNLNLLRSSKCDPLVDMQRMDRQLVAAHNLRGARGINTAEILRQMSACGLQLHVGGSGSTRLVQ